MGLDSVQRDFRAWLEHEDSAAAEKLPLSDKRGLDVYLNNFRAQLMACLEASFPITHSWLGDDGFRPAAARHIEKVPPHSWTIDDYALDFPTSLALEYPNDPEVSELAFLELALSEAFVAADAEPLALEDLGNVDWEEALLRRVPSAAQLTLRTNADDIWGALNNEEDPPAPVTFDQPNELMIWRYDNICQLRRLSDEEVPLMPHLIRSLRFTDLCDMLVEQHGPEEGIQQAGQLLAQWTAGGILRKPD